MAKILFIDDESEIVEWMQGYFEERKNHLILIASEADKGLSLVEETKPDLVVLDIAMPKMNGVEVLEKIREKGNKTPVIIYTGVYDEQYKNRCEELGISGYVRKPSSLADFEEEIEKALKA